MMDNATAYDWRVGRWSRMVGDAFLAWLDQPAGLRWLDLGCGGGALSQAVLDHAAPSRVTGIDPNTNAIETARRRVIDPRAEFREAKAEALSFGAGDFDVAISGLAFNFMDDANAALAEATRVLGAGKCIAGYLWDFAGEMQVMRRFFDAANAVDAGARKYDQGPRFPLCKPEPMRALFAAAGLTDIALHTVDVAADYPDFDTYWDGMTIGEGSVPDYARTAPPATLAAIRADLAAGLAQRADGGFTLNARAFAVRGVTPAR